MFYTKEIILYGTVNYNFKKVLENLPKFFLNVLSAAGVGAHFHINSFLNQ